MAKKKADLEAEVEALDEHELLAQHEAQAAAQHAAPAPTGPVDTNPLAAVTAALKALPAEAVEQLLKEAGLVPTTAGLSAEQMQAIATTSGAANARAMQLALRKENPNYPEKSVFNPRGVFDDDGNALEPKAKFRRPTYFQGVRLGGELETETEIELCNRFTETREIPSKQWKAEVKMHGNEERLYITVPSKTVDDRMNLPHTMELILMELLQGSEAVNPASLQKQIEALQAQVAELQGKDASAA